MTKEKRQKVFLIEDELDIAYVYQTALKGADIDVDVMNTGKEAMEKIQDAQKGTAVKPVLVLLDLVLPDINGLEILYAIRKHDATKDVAVFILSNYSSDALHNMSYIKPEKFLVKANITPTQLVELVKEQLLPINL
jgi:DNA-binding response OmpR family regulator